MIILITKSELFTTDPDIRFAREYNVGVGIWRDLWRRYSILDYSQQEMSDYFTLKTGKPISKKGLKRWIMRTKLYTKTKHIVDKGCLSVNSEFFGDLEWFVIKELTRNMKSSVHHNPKTLP